MKYISIKILLLSFFLLINYTCENNPSLCGVIDNCGVCDNNPENDCTQDCYGVWGGDAQLDCSGICEGNAKYDCENNCITPNQDGYYEGNFIQEGYCDCENSVLEDECGMCSNANYAHSYYGPNLRCGCHGFPQIAYGGISEQYNFTILGQNEHVWGISFKNNQTNYETIPAGSCGVLTELEINGASNSLKDIIIYTPNISTEPVTFNYLSSDYCSDNSSEINDGCTLNVNTLFITFDNKVLFNSSVEIRSFEFKIVGGGVVKRSCNCDGSLYDCTYIPNQCDIPGIYNEPGCEESSACYYNNEYSSVSDSTKCVESNGNWRNGSWILNDNCSTYGDGDQTICESTNCIWTEYNPQTRETCEDVNCEWDNNSNENESNFIEECNEFDDMDDCTAEGCFWNSDDGICIKKSCSYFNNMSDCENGECYWNNETENCNRCNTEEDYYWDTDAQECGKCSNECGECSFICPESSSIQSDLDNDGICDSEDICISEEHIIDSCGSLTDSHGREYCGCAGEFGLPSNRCPIVDCSGVCGGNNSSVSWDSNNDLTIVRDQVQSDSLNYVDCLLDNNYSPDFLGNAEECNNLSEYNLYPVDDLCGCNQTLNNVGCCCEISKDECGICNGPGAIYTCGCTDDFPTQNSCDCNGNVEDCNSICGGPGILINEVCCAGGDFDSDNICDTVDDCIGEYDVCGICNGNGIPEGECDCDGNSIDCIGECEHIYIDNEWIENENYSNAINDECGLCNGPGKCECDDGSLSCNCCCEIEGDIQDNCGVCDTDPTNDCTQDCLGVWGGSSVVDECNVCNGPGEIYDCGCSNIEEEKCDCEGNVVCLSLDKVNETTYNLMYSSSVSIKGFQFNHTNCIGSLSGGAAATAGFNVTNANGTVIGFSFTGQSIQPASNAILTVLEQEENGTILCSDCIENNFTLSDGNDEPIDEVSYSTNTYITDECDICDGPGEIYDCGCGDIPNSECDCNGNILDECGICGGTGPEENYDCEDNCIVDLDCAGECGGNHHIFNDECVELSGCTLPNNNISFYNGSIFYNIDTSFKQFSFDLDEPEDQVYAVSFLEDQGDVATFSAPNLGCLGLGDCSIYDNEEDCSNPDDLLTCFWSGYDFSIYLNDNSYSHDVYSECSGNNIGLPSGCGELLILSNFNNDILPVELKNIEFIDLSGSTISIEYYNP